MDISDYFTEQVIVGAKDECEIQWNHRENRAVCWNKQGWAMEDMGLEGWVEMVGRTFHDKVGKQECMFSSGLSYSLIDQREEAERERHAHTETGWERERYREIDRNESILGPWGQNYWIKPPQNPSNFCYSSYMRKCFLLFRPVWVGISVSCYRNYPHWW